MKTIRSKHETSVSGNLCLHRRQREFLGGDQINLLEQINEHGSITKAAKAVGISCKTAWDTVNLINNLAEKPLVDRLAGGKGGGGTYLTAEGEKVINQFKTIQEEHRKFLVNLEGRLGDTASAVITHDSAKRLELKVGGHACALFKASSVIIGVS